MYFIKWHIIAVFVANVLPNIKFTMPSFSYRIKSKDDKQVSIYVSFRPQNSKSVFSRTGFTIHPHSGATLKKELNQFLLKQRI